MNKCTKTKLLRKLIFRRNYSNIFHQEDMNSNTMLKPIENSIKRKLETTLRPLYCNIINESYMHNVPEGSETHFKVMVVSEKFNNQPLIERHRIINELLQVELQENIHALSIIAKTPEQWEASNKTVSASPACRGGFGK